MKHVLAFLLMYLLLAPNSYGGSLTTALEERMLAHDRKGAHSELENIMRQDRDEFYRLVDAYDSILCIFETYDKLEKADEKTELQYINEFKMYLKNNPRQNPFSQKVVDAIKDVTSKVNLRIETRNESIRLAAEQREKERAERELAEAARQEEQRIKADEEGRRVQKEREELIAKQEQERLHNEKLAKAQEAVLLSPEYYKQSLVCQVCGGIEGKKELTQDLKRYQSYERKYGVINLTTRGNAISMDMEYDTQISEGKEQYKQIFKKAFPMNVCNKFDAEACQGQLDSIEKTLIEKYIAVDK